MTPGEQLKEQIAQLEEALLTSNPGMPTMLRTIHKALQADKDIVTTLTDEEVGVFVSGIMAQSNKSIATAAVKKKSSKSLKATTLEDLGAL